MEEVKKVSLGVSHTGSCKYCEYRLYLRLGRLGCDGIKHELRRSVDRLGGLFPENSPKGAWIILEHEERVLCRLGTLQIKERIKRQ